MKNLLYLMLCLVPLSCFAQEIANRNENIYLSFYKPSVMTARSLPEASLSGDVINQKIRRNGLDIMLGVESELSGFNSFVVGLFIGGGKLGDDIKEYIAGVDLKKVFWLSKGIAMPVSLGIAMRIDDYSNQYIPDGYYDGYNDGYEYDKEGSLAYITKVDIIPSIDLQYFIDERISLYIGYMYRITADYKKRGYEYDVIIKEEEQIFNIIPGTLRFGIKRTLRDIL